MESSDKGFSSSNTPRSPLAPKSSPSGSRENNENVTSQDQMISKLHYPKKPVAKHFMSPTISASSKVSVPRKKILAERNEYSSLSDTQIWKTQDMDMKNSIGHYDLSPSWFIPSKNCDRVSNDDGVVTDSSLKPYDPLTNYLSPRPKYLRYHPNKRRLIFHRKVSESREGKDGTGPGEEESLADAQDSLVHAQENEENLVEVDGNTDDDDDVEENEEEEDDEVGEYEGIGWSLRGVLKFLLTFYLCFLSKTYIYSTNSSTPSPSQQAILSFKDDYTMIQNQICEPAYMEVYGGDFLEVEERDSELEVHNILMAEGDNLETVDSGDAEMVEEDELDMEKRNSETVESPCDYEMSKNGEPYNVQMIEVDNVEKVKNSEVELVEVDNEEKVKNSEVELVEVDNEEKVKNSEVELVEVDNEEKVKNSEVELVEVDCVERIESSEAEMVENDMSDMEDSNTESVEYDCDNDVAKTGEFSEEVSPAVVVESKVIEGCEVEYIEGCEVEYIAEAKTAQSDGAGSYELVKEVKGSDQLKKPDSFQEDQTPLNTEGVNQPDTELLESHEMPVNLVDKEFDYGDETEKAGSNILVVAGVSIFSIILASLAFFCRPRKGKTTSIEDSQPTVKPLKSRVEDKITRVRLAVEKVHIEKTITSGFSDEEEEHIRKEIESSTRPLTLSNSIAEAPQEASCFIHAPTIELLGEFVIKGVCSSHKKIPVLESEESNASHKGSKSSPVSVPSQTFTRENSRIVFIWNLC
ncbi:uncharacterized protein LOC111380109 isoform X2 [Olea europaea var. sylvestris]|uniref:uncharacterized protein LOC111380109 isoform X2 n=1 Tax=Olea europaea var. sylvestris TaxID=158386 RepID=UPI000C1CDB83|nr:uncharacterized protein LOC111380109 isoform X2 [Olea europaea var. sylvestris]